MKHPQWLRDAICAGYAAGGTVAEMSQSLYRSEGSIRSILVRAGVYVSKASQAKQLRATVAEEHGF